jgi:hypothetical protein
LVSNEDRSQSPKIDKFKMRETAIDIGKWVSAGPAYK